MDQINKLYLFVPNHFDVFCKTIQQRLSNDRSDTILWQNLLNYRAHMHLSMSNDLDIHAYVPDNLRRLSGVLGEPRIIHDFRAGSHYRVIAVLQHLFKYLHQSKQRKSYNNLVYKTVVSNLTTKFDN